jgi:FixJ family two-component response regulator
MGQPATVFVVDPDASVRHSLESAIRRAGWTPEITASPRTRPPSSPRSAWPG